MSEELIEIEEEEYTSNYTVPVFKKNLGLDEASQEMGRRFLYNYCPDFDHRCLFHVHQ